MLFPKVGDVLIVKDEFSTGLNDFTSGPDNKILRGTICTVLESNESAAVSRTDGEIILTLLFAKGVIEWRNTWSDWHGWLRFA
jgi:hypothetical protein